MTDDGLSAPGRAGHPPPNRHHQNQFSLRSVFCQPSRIAGTRVFNQWFSAFFSIRRGELIIQ